MILGLISYYEHRCCTLFWTFTEQERATSASPWVTGILIIKRKPFPDAEHVKECTFASIEEVVTDEKPRNRVIDSLKKIHPLSDWSGSTAKIKTIPYLPNPFMSLLAFAHKTVHWLCHGNYFQLQFHLNCMKKDLDQKCRLQKIQVLN